MTHLKVERVAPLALHPTFLRAEAEQVDPSPVLHPSELTLFLGLALSAGALNPALGWKGELRWVGGGEEQPNRATQLDPEKHKAHADLMRSEGYSEEEIRRALGHDPAQEDPILAINDGTEAIPY